MRTILKLAIHAGLWVVIINLLFPNDDPEQRQTTEVNEYFAAKNDAWGSFCSSNDCSKIPMGFVIGTVGRQTFTLPLVNSQIGDEGCRLVSHGTQYSEYIDHVIQRGADYHPAGMEIDVECKYGDPPSIHWEDQIRTSRGYIWLEEPTLHRRFDHLLNSASQGDDKPSYESRDALLQPLTPDFREFVSEQLSGERVFLSTQRLFQDRHAVVICRHSCEITTFSFEGDEGLNTPYLDYQINFERLSTNCNLFEPQWSCGPFLEQLTSIARLIRFMGTEIDLARSRVMDDD